MKIIKIILMVGALVAFFLAGWLLKDFLGSTEIVEIPKTIIERQKPLKKYSIENLSQATVPSTKLSVNYDNQNFVMEFSPDMGATKKVSGRATLPENAKTTYPIIIMIRGYVDQEIYQTGIGTKAAADFFTENNFITLAPDFLGYADSSEEAGNIFETRFQTYTTMLSLLASLDQVPMWDKQNVFIWAHSNGGQIALTTLEITGVDYPTTLWAPVTKPFPYSILYYTDESEDGGKLIRRELAKFEDDYDTDDYSLTKYLSRINAPLVLHQGTLDDAVPTDWSKSFVAKMRDLDKEIKYVVHPGADHNMRPAWDTAIEIDLEFFNNHRES